MSRPEPITTLTSELATEILNKILDQLQTEEYVKKLDEARDNVGNEMLKMMQFLFPIVMQVHLDVLKQFGFPDGREGMVKFASMLRNLEREDPEIARLHGMIKAYYLPAVNATTETTSNDERVASSGS